MEENDHGERHVLYRDGYKFFRILNISSSLVTGCLMIFFSFEAESLFLGIIGGAVVLVTALLIANHFITSFFYDDDGFEWRDLAGRDRIEYKDIVSFKLVRSAVSTSRSSYSYYVVELKDGTKKQPSIPCGQDNVFLRAFLSFMVEANPSIHVDVPIYRKNIFGEF